MGLTLIISIGIAAFLLIYFAFQWDKKEHYLFQLLVSFFFISLLLLLPKAIIDNPDDCDIVVANQTTVGNFTEFGYEQLCIPTEYKTHTIFYKTIMWFFRLFIIYIFLYFNYVIWLKSKLTNIGFIKNKK